MNIPVSNSEINIELMSNQNVPTPPQTFSPQIEHYPIYILFHKLIRARKMSLENIFWKICQIRCQKGQ